MRQLLEEKEEVRKSCPAPRLMVCDRYEHAPSEEFAKTTLVPIADGVVIFYEQHDPKPEPGKAPLDKTLRLKLIPFFCC